MATTSEITLYYSPRSRAEIALWMLEELGQPYETRVLSLKRGEHKRPEYLAVNPMGKVPAIEHRGVVVTEAPAICAYLADEYPEAGLSVSIGESARRASYLRWLFFAHGCVEPAVVDRLLDRKSDAPGTLGYGVFEQTFEVLAGALAAGPHLLGEQFTAADVVVGAAVRWGVQLTGVVPNRPEFAAYLKQLDQRPGWQRAMAKSHETQAELDRQYAAEAALPGSGKSI